MKNLTATAIALSLLGAATVANAAELNLTTAQKQTIYQSVKNEKSQPMPAGFQARPGATVPQTVELHALPISVASQWPASKDYQFAKMQNNEVLLVSPKDRHVAEIVMQPGTTTGQGK